jgi:hypothetical protein
LYAHPTRPELSRARYALQRRPGELRASGFYDNRQTYLLTLVFRILKNAIRMQDISLFMTQPSGIIFTEHFTKEMSKNPVRCTFGSPTRTAHCANCLDKGIYKNKGQWLPGIRARTRSFHNGQARPVLHRCSAGGCFEEFGFETQ